jgi:antitoxin component of RelBE/YafQ-DinJ toxin-antitoxin module
MSGLNLFAQLTKVDEEKRLVFGRAAQQVPDKSGEIFDYATSKPYFESWSSEINKAAKAASGTENLGNVRAMHNKVAAGKLVELDFNDAEKAIDVAAYIADDNEWKKVLGGVYTGFSIGGGYVKKWNVVEDGKSLKAYTAKPSEISLADSPCVPSCTFFEIRKTDGSTEKKEFMSEDEKAESKDEDKAEGGESEEKNEDCAEKMLKVYVNGKEDAGKMILAEGCEVGSHHTFGDEEFVISKIVDDIVHVVPVIDGVVEPEVAGTEADVLKLQAVMEEHKLTVADVVEMTLAKVAEREVTPLQKIAASLEELAGIGEDHHVATIAKLLHDMVAESDELEKVGARNSAADKKHIQAIHDASHNLGADCAKEEMAEKTAAASTLDKSLQAAFDELTKRVDELSKAATAPKVALRVVPVSKDQDNGAQQASNTTDIQPVYDAFGKLDPAATAMKLVHATGGANIIPGKL